MTIFLMGCAFFAALFGCKWWMLGFIVAAIGCFLIGDVFSEDPIVFVGKKND